MIVCGFESARFFGELLPVQSFVLILYLYKCGQS